MILGVHVSIAGGILKALERAQRLSCTTMQIFSRSPRGGPAPRLAPRELKTFHRTRQALRIEPLVVHAPYILNLASSDPVVWNRSVALYRQEYQRCQQLKAHYLVTHVGSHQGAGEATGITRVADAINRTLDGLEPSVMILLENTAGAGQGLGYQFEQLRAIRDGVVQHERVGICLDTAHLFAAGFAIHTAHGLEAMWQQLEAVLGLESVKVVHLNDSKAAWNSRVDRHWHIGEGHIGLEAMRRIINDPRLSRLPLILETPKKTDADDPRNLATVRSLTASQTVLSMPPPT